MQRPTFCTVLLATVILAATCSVAHAATPGFTTLYDFGSSGDGASPEANLAIGAGGVLYGTTLNGGAYDYGTVFSLTPPSSPGGAWAETLLHEFTNGNDGGHPAAGLVVGPSGVLYGTASLGGTSGDGVVFALAPPASPGGAWVENVLFNFPGGAFGGTPFAGLLRAGDGALYGTAGVAFELIPPAAPGGLWTEKVLHSFGSAGDGASPQAALTYSGGVLYGTTAEGGAYGSGTVFSLTPPSSPGGAWSESVLYSFTGGDDGGDPQTALVAGANGVLYGTTTIGGGPDKWGTVFSLTPPVTSGSSWTLTQIYSFTLTSGAYPLGTLLLMGSGVLYGTTNEGGLAESGNIFRLAPPGTSGGDWTFTVIYTFDGPNGLDPYAGLVLGSGGVLYGTTDAGGTHGRGTVFALTL
jgi:uncharacterized repeat protein (TIGR03803 family)